MQKACSVVPGDLKSMLGSDGANHQRLDTILGVIYRARRTGHIEDHIHLAGIERFSNVVFDELEARLARKMFEIAKVAGKEVIHCNHSMSIPDQSINHI